MKSITPLFLLLAVVFLVLPAGVLSFGIEEQVYFCEPLNITLNGCMALNWTLLVDDTPVCENATNVLYYNNTEILNYTQDFNYTFFDLKFNNLTDRLSSLSVSDYECEDSFQWLQEENRNKEEMAKIEKGTSCPDISEFISQEDCDVQTSIALTDRLPAQPGINNDNSLPIQKDDDVFSYWPILVIVLVGGFLAYKKFGDRFKPRTNKPAPAYKEVYDHDRSPTKENFNDYHPQIPTDQPKQSPSSGLPFGKQ
jgi:hypothetical protein